MFSITRYQVIRTMILNIKSPQSSPASTISTGCVRYNANYYDSLGITKKSTQEEIKAAYYRLSMIYHPDKNQGSETAAVKFREITQAYEVLGNFRLRRLYDKGIIHTAGSQYAQRSHDATQDVEPEVDDSTTKFYKSRFKKSTVADTEGHTPIYNFDEWSRQHYGKSFVRRQAAKEKYARTEAREKEHKLVTQNEILLLGMAIVCACIYLKFLSESSYDTPKEKAIKAAQEKLEKKSTT